MHTKTLNDDAEAGSERHDLSAHDRRHISNISYTNKSKRPDQKEADIVEDKSGR